MLSYLLRRSRRKTIALEITPEGTLLVRAPLHMPEKAIRTFVEKHENWAAARLPGVRARAAVWAQITPEIESALRKAAEHDLLPRAAHWAAVMQLHPSGLRITGAQKRFGSCSGRGTLCFSWRLMLYPQAARDYVVVHELAHLVHFNHSPDFYALVQRYLPDYKKCQSLLRAAPDLPDFLQNKS